VLFILITGAQTTGAGYYKLESHFLTETDFTEYNLRVYCELIGIKHIDIVLKQSKAETGHYKSGVFKKFNNLFGMKVPTQRKTTAKRNINTTYAVYSHWSESVQDYLILQRQIMERFQDKDYYETLVKSGYCENEKYVKLLKSIK